MTWTEFVNGLIDSLLATADRLLQLPMFVVLAVGLLLAALLALPLLWLRGSPGRVWLRRTLLFLEVALAVCLAAWVVDRRLVALQQEISELRTRLNTPVSASNATAGPEVTTPRHRQVLLFDAGKCQAELGEVFGELTFRPMVYDEATDFVQVRIASPLAQAWLVVVDLRSAGLAIEIGATLDRKTMTSAFARTNHCSVAINGEAGNSPFPNSGLGDWRGHLVRRGEVLLREPAGRPRPVLAFDAQNHATFTAMSAPNRELPANAHNVLWGRFDVLVAGEVQLGDLRNRQPRTAMAIDCDGNRLFLLVVDGRQPRASMGFTRAEVGLFLKTFGACDGMLCDEGGSSCMYLEQFGGIANIPSDNQGQERPTYTHFGLSRHGT